jgi:hypothetical protein
MHFEHTVAACLIGCYLVGIVRNRQKGCRLAPKAGDERKVDGTVVGKAAVGRCLFFLALEQNDGTVIEAIVASPQMPERRVRQLKNDIKIGDRLSCIGVACDSSARKPRTPDAVFALQCTSLIPLAFCVRDNTGICRMVCPEDIPCPKYRVGPNCDARPENPDTSHGDKRLKSARAEVFAQFLHDQFGEELHRGVLDVAGGRGELSLELVLTDVPALVVDPRPSSGLLSKSLRKKLRSSGHPPLSAWNVFFPPTDAESGHAGFLKKCAVVAGLHPDEATEAIVDYAIAHNKGFAVIPCCVFARLFPGRWLTKNTGGGHQVRTYQELLLYLSRKHPAIQSTQLNFQGKNTVLWAKAEDLSAEQTMACGTCRA